MSAEVKEQAGTQEVAASLDQAKMPIPDPSRLLEGPESFTLKDFDREVPDDKWEAVDLIGYAKHQANLIQMLQRTLAIHVFRLGMALSLYRRHHLGHGDWKTFLEEQGLSGPTAWRAIQLFERADSEEEVVNLGITEAYLKFGILKEKAAKKKDEQSSSGGKEPAAEAAPEATAEGTPKAAAQKKVSGQPEDKVTPGSGETEPKEEGDGDDDSTPPKEPESPNACLMQAKRLLQYVQEQVAEIDWEQEDEDAFRDLLQDIIEVAQRIDAALA